MLMKTPIGQLFARKLKRGVGIHVDQSYERLNGVPFIVRMIPNGENEFQHNAKS